MDIDRLKEIIAIFESSKLSEMSIVTEGLNVSLKKGAEGTVERTAHRPGGQVAPESAEVSSPADIEVAPSLPTINSPMIGIFYRSSSPKAEPFVKVGSEVQRNETLCVIEAMKLMNEVKAEYPARIVEILVENGQAVEYGQPLFVVQPL